MALAQKKDPQTAVEKSLGVWKKLNNGTKDVDTFWVDVIAVDKANMVKEIIKSGFHTTAEVYKNLPQSQWPKN